MTKKFKLAIFILFLSTISCKKEKNKSSVNKFDYGQFVGDYEIGLFSKENKFLGCWTCDSSHEDSIDNEAGLYGSSFGEYSIRNSDSIYGERYGNDSVCNRFSENRSSFYDGSGEYYGKASMNEYVDEGVCNTDSSYYNYDDCEALNTYCNKSLGLTTSTLNSSTTTTLRQTTTTWTLSSTTTTSTTLAPTITVTMKYKRGTGNYPCSHLGIIDCSIAKTFNHSDLTRIQTTYPACLISQQYSNGYTLDCTNANTCSSKSIICNSGSGYDYFYVCTGIYKTSDTSCTWSFY